MADKEELLEAVFEASRTYLAARDAYREFPSASKFHVMARARAALKEANDAYAAWRIARDRDNPEPTIGLEAEAQQNSERESGPWT